MFRFDISDKLRKVLTKLAKKDPVISKSINKKVKEVISRDTESIRSYKNLRHDLKQLKRIHITEWLVLTFPVDIENNFILFVDLDHRDNIYKKKK